MEKNFIKTVYGYFKDGKLTVDGKPFSCGSYKSTKTQYDDTTGVFNLQWDEDLKIWIIFQVFPVELFLG